MKSQDLNFKRLVDLFSMLSRGNFVKLIQNQVHSLVDFITVFWDVRTMKIETMPINDANCGKNFVLSMGSSSSHESRHPQSFHSR